jgi:hypothetical protein
MWGTGTSQQLLTISMNPSCLIQKFSNLKILALGILVSMEIMQGL